MGRKERYGKENVNECGKKKRKIKNKGNKSEIRQGGTIRGKKEWLEGKEKRKGI